MDTNLYKKGLSIRKKVLGDEYVERAVGNTDNFTKDFQDLLTEYCWGGIWGREGLSLKQKSINNLCMLAALGRTAEFELHLRGARRNGCTWEEIRETLLQIAVYCGMPAAVSSFQVARRVRDEEEGDRPSS